MYSLTVSLSLQNTRQRRTILSNCDRYVSSMKSKVENLHFLRMQRIFPLHWFAELYKNRWQIELFFKWLKQHLKIKKFWGTTENAVRIQIYVAICTYLLVTIVKNNMKLERSTYEVLQILSISLTDKTHLKDLFDKTKFQYDKDRFGPNGPNLFNV